MTHPVNWKQIDALLKSGKNVEAIKLYQFMTGKKLGAASIAVTDRIDKLFPTK